MSEEPGKYVVEGAAPKVIKIETSRSNGMSIWYEGTFTGPVTQADIAAHHPIKADCIFGYDFELFANGRFRIRCFID